LTQEEFYKLLKERLNEVHFWEVKREILHY
jgi:hypothetical protein